MAYGRSRYLSRERACPYCGQASHARRHCVAWLNRALDETRHSLMVATRLLDSALSHVYGAEAWEEAKRAEQADRAEGQGGEGRHGDLPQRDLP